MKPPFATMTVLMVCSALACRSSPPAPAVVAGGPTFRVTPGVTPLTADAHQHHPIALRLVAGEMVRDASGQRVDLELRFERRVAWTAPMRVTLGPLTGVTVEGESRGFTFPDAPADTTQVARFGLRFREVPAGDFVVAFASGDEATAYRGQVVYRFGRPEPMPAPLHVANAPLTVGGVVVSHPVELR